MAKRGASPSERTAANRPFRPARCWAFLLRATDIARQVFPITVAMVVALPAGADTWIPPGRPLSKEERVQRAIAFADVYCLARVSAVRDTSITLERDPRYHRIFHYCLITVESVQKGEIPGHVTGAQLAIGLDPESNHVERLRDLTLTPDNEVFLSLRRIPDEYSSTTGRPFPSFVDYVLAVFGPESGVPMIQVPAAARQHTIDSVSAIAHSVTLDAMRSDSDLIVHAVPVSRCQSLSGMHCMEYEIREGFKGIVPTRMVRVYTHWPQLQLHEEQVLFLRSRADGDFEPLRTDAGRVPLRGANSRRFGAGGDSLLRVLKAPD